MEIDGAFGKNNYDKLKENMRSRGYSGTYSTRRKSNTQIPISKIATGIIFGIAIWKIYKNIIQPFKEFCSEAFGSNEEKLRTVSKNNDRIFDGEIRKVSLISERDKLNAEDVDYYIHE